MGQPLLWKCMEFKSELLLELELNRKGVGNLNRLAVVTARIPVRHCLYNSYCFFVECRVTAAEHADIFNRTGFRNDEFYDYLTLNAFFCCNGRIVHVVAEPFVHRCLTAGEFRLLFNHCHVVDFLFFNRLFFCDDLVDDTRLVQVFNAFCNVDLTDH